MSTNLDVQQVLAQMRATAAQMESSLKPDAAQQQENGVEFSNLLKESLDSVNATQKQAGALRTAFDAGDPNTDLGEVMVAAQKAKVSFQAMTQVRNKLVEAYKDVMSMPL